MKTVVPGPRDDRALRQPHVLTIVDDDGEKDYEVEHPDDCPVACSWFPPKNGKPWFMEFRRDVDEIPFGDFPEEGERMCLMRWELEGNGIDSLSVIAFRIRDKATGVLSDQPVIEGVLDPDYTPVTEWEAEWKRLRPGRYLIEAWYTPGGWAGDYYDADGGLTLLAAEPFGEEHVSA